MLKTDNAQALIEAVITELAHQARGNAHAMNDKARSPADRQYFTGGFDAISMTARRIAETGLVNREQFLTACGLTP